MHGFELLKLDKTKNDSNMVTGQKIKQMYFFRTDIGFCK